MYIKRYVINGTHKFVRKLKPSYASLAFYSVFLLFTLGLVLLKVVQSRKLAVVAAVITLFLARRNLFIDVSCPTQSALVTYCSHLTCHLSRQIVGGHFQRSRILNSVRSNGILLRSLKLSQIHLGKKNREQLSFFRYNNSEQKYRKTIVKK